MSKRTLSRRTILYGLARHALSQGPRASMVSSARFLRLEARLLHWRLRCRFLPSVGLDTPKSTAIILSYKRPFNVDGIVRSLLKCEFIEQIIVSNNNPELDLKPFIRVQSERLTLLQQNERRGCAYRFQIAQEVDSEHFICVDDDLFFHPETFHRLHMRHCSFPDAPTGILGFDVDWSAQKKSQGTQLIRKRNINASVDVLNRIYLFNHEQLSRFWSNRDALVNADVSFLDQIDLVDDIILSSTGNCKARVWQVGDYIPCPTGMATAISMHGLPGIMDVRFKALSILQERCPLTYQR
jgi:hypothetical protein